MIKEHAELVSRKAQERKIDLSRLTTYPEYYTLKEELEKMIATLEKIDTLDFESKISVETQAMANKLAKEKITRFLADVGAYTIKANNILDNTYE